MTPAQRAAEHLHEQAAQARAIRQVDGNLTREEREKDQRKEEAGFASKRAASGRISAAKRGCFQRGIADTWLLAIIVIVALVALAGAIKAWQSYTNGLIERGRAHGVAETSQRFEARDNAALQAAIAERNAAQAKADQAERSASGRINAAAAAYQKGITRANAQRETDLLAVHAGLDRLCLDRPATRIAGIGEAPGGPGNAPTGRSGAAGTGDQGLRSGTEGRLLGIATEANRLRDKANALSEIARADRAQINGQ